MDDKEVFMDDKEVFSVPYVAHEGEVSRVERINKREFIIILVLIFSFTFLFTVNNLAWLYYESQYDKYMYEQDGEGINTVNYGSQGDLTVVPENTD